METRTNWDAVREHGEGDDIFSKLGSSVVDQSIFKFVLTDRSGLTEGNLG